MAIVQQVVPQVQSLPIWVEYVRALGTPIAALIGAVIAGFIAYRQMRTASNKLKLDLFDKRMEVYNAARDLVSHEIWNVEITEERLNAITDAINAAPWLLDDKVDAYLNGLKQELRGHRQSRVQPSRSAEDVKKMVADKRESKRKHVAELKAVFDPFLRLAH
jgi:hypothetical protein